MLFYSKHHSNHSRTFSAVNHLLTVINAKLVSMYLQLPMQVEKCLMKSQTWCKGMPFAKVDYWIWITIKKLRIVNIFWKLSYQLYWKQLQKWLRYLDITFVTKLLTIFVDDQDRWQPYNTEEIADTYKYTLKEIQWKVMCSDPWTFYISIFFNVEPSIAEILIVADANLI